MNKANFSEKDYSQLKVDLKKLVDGSRIPTVSTVEIDGRFKALSLRAGNSVTGPYRALKLTPYYSSDARVTSLEKAMKMAELYYRFDSESIEALGGSNKNQGEYDKAKGVLEDQKGQIPNGFKMVNLDVSAVDSAELPPDGNWIEEYVKLASAEGSNVLLMIPPGDALSASAVLKYQLAAMSANKKLANPMYAAGYIPPMSADECIALMDDYVSAGINTLIYDFRGRRITEGSLVHLAAITAEGQSPVYVHGLQVSAYKMHEPFYTLYDLVMARVGVQSISNLRRVGGGKKGAKTPMHMKLRLKCVHGYVMPSLKETYSQRRGKFSCPHCDLKEIDAAVSENRPGKITRATIKQNVETSCQEFETMKVRIKENTFKAHFEGKPGLDLLEPQFKRLEKAISREKERKLTKQTRLNME